MQFITRYEAEIKKKLKRKHLKPVMFLSVKVVIESTDLS